MGYRFNESLMRVYASTVREVSIPLKIVGRKRDQNDCSFFKKRDRDVTSCWFRGGHEQERNTRDRQGQVNVVQVNKETTAPNDYAEEVNTSKRNENRKPLTSSVIYIEKRLLSLNRSAWRSWDEVLVNRKISEACISEKDKKTQGNKRHESAERSLL